jgi:hypothetical protein
MMTQAIMQMTPIIRMPGTSSNQYIMDFPVAPKFWREGQPCARTMVAMSLRRQTTPLGSMAVSPLVGSNKKAPAETGDQVSN